MSLSNVRLAAIFSLHYGCNCPAWTKVREGHLQMPCIFPFHVFLLDPDHSQHLHDDDDEVDADAGVTLDGFSSLGCDSDLELLPASCKKVVKKDLDLVGLSHVELQQIGQHEYPSTESDKENTSKELNVCHSDNEDKQCVVVGIPKAIKVSSVEREKGLEIRQVQSSPLQTCSSASITFSALEGPSKDDDVHIDNIKDSLAEVVELGGKKQKVKSKEKCKSLKIDIHVDGKIRTDCRRKGLHENRQRPLARPFLAAIIITLLATSVVLALIFCEIHEQSQLLKFSAFKQHQYRPKSPSNIKWALTMVRSFGSTTAKLLRSTTSSLFDSYSHLVFCLCHPRDPACHPNMNPFTKAYDFMTTASHQCFAIFYETFTGILEFLRKEFSVFSMQAGRLFRRLQNQWWIGV